MITAPAPALRSSLPDQLGTAGRVSDLPPLIGKLLPDLVGALEVPVGASGLPLVGQPSHRVRGLVDRLLEQVLEPQRVQHLAQAAIPERLPPCHSTVPLGDPVEENRPSCRGV